MEKKARFSLASQSLTAEKIVGKQIIMEKLISDTFLSKNELFQTNYVIMFVDVSD